MKKLLLLAAACIFTLTTQAQTGIYFSQMHKADSLVKDFLQTWNIDGAAVAISKDGKLIYNRGFGYADQDSTEVGHPYHLYRIASVSKPITGIAVMKLVENNQLSLSDTVFGPNRIITDPYYLNAITDNRIYNITVKQLLEHTAGWDRNIPCDGKTHCDPIGFPLHVTATLGEPNPVGDSALIKFLITKGLNYTPGTTYAYSNIGYLVLGKIIEKKTGMKYEEYVKSAILDPIGICDMHLGYNLPGDKQEREGEYNSPYTTLSCYGNNQTVPWQYGGWNLEAMNAHGGWIATAADLVRLMLAVDNFSTVPDILSSSTISQMVTPSSVSNYAKGWFVNASNNWWHNGSLDGTAAEIVRTNTGYTWAILLNARNNGAFWNDLDDLGWHCINSTATYPPVDIFAPASNVSGMTVSKTSATSVDISWTNGSGDMRLVVARDSIGTETWPEDGTDYTANSAFGSGQDIGSNNYVVYAGTGNSVSVTGLNALKTYVFTVYEYAKNTTTGNNAIYKLGCSGNKVFNMTGVNVGHIAGIEGFSVSPNPTTGNVFISLPASSGQVQVTITNTLGRIVQKYLMNGSGNMDISSLSQGIYFITVEGQGHRATQKLIKQ